MDRHLETHLHWIIFAYERVEPGTGSFLNNTTVDLICSSADDAMYRVKQLMPDRQYHINMIVEHFDGQPCGGK